MRLTDEQLSFYDDNGYVILEDLIGAEQRSEILDNASRIIAEAEYAEKSAMVCWDKQIVNGAVTLPPERRELGVFKLTHMQHHDAYFREYIQNAPEQDAVSQIVGEDLKLVAFQVVMKPPGHGQWQPYHQDSYYFPIQPQRCCGVWVALDEATVENGCLWVVPGSHKSEIVEHLIPDGIDNLNDAFYEAQGVDKDKGIPCKLKPGSAVMIHSKVFHMSGPNRSATRRRGIVAHYANAAWTYTGKDESGPNYQLVRGREYAGSL